MNFWILDSLVSGPAEACALLIPLVFAVAAMLSRRERPFRVALAAAGTSALLAAAFATLSAFGSTQNANALIRVDTLSAVMLLLVCVLAVVIVRYSRNYLDADPRALHYARWLLLTLAAVSALVSTGHLVVLAGAWTLTSLALHQLLTFFRTRTPALVAAHKKFLVSRLADVCLWSAMALTAHATGTLYLDGVLEWAAAQTELSTQMHIAALLFVIAAALKSAQLPFHGWLTQVMEAPTPVSALLHAGIVNLGGFLMIRLAPLMALAALAQYVLVAIGTCTVVLAALIVRTRVSVKVGLAWSTCAQMGFMLVECGLGLWPLALLHLVAHSFYKAHAFLSAGSAVDAWRLNAMAARSKPSALRWALALVVTTTASLVTSLAAGFPLESLVLSLIVAWSAVPWLARPLTFTTVVSAALVPLLYAALHTAAFALWPATEHFGTLAAPLTVLAGFAALFAVESAVELRPHGAFARRLHTWLFAGFYLDERFTRLTFRLWPPHLPEATARPLTENAETLS
ncbi:MAG: NADH-quinone oxidoreductase subunit L [Polyangiales bacterium]